MARRNMAMMTVIILIMMMTMTHAFNLDTSRSRVLTGPSDSDFGFSVALWSDVDGKPSLVVGAPKGKNSTLGLPLGNIFICDAEGKGCQAYPRLPEASVEDKSQAALVPGLTSQGVSMAFGHTLSTIKKNSKLAVCAPHYPRYENKSVELRGACYLLNNSLAEPVKFVPYERRAAKTNVFQYAMVGFSAQLFIEDSYKLVSGGPAGFSGRGVVNVKDFEVNGVPLANRWTLNPSEVNLDSTYEGWQVAVGKFDGRKLSIAASAVNYGTYIGQVKFYPVDIKGKSPILSVKGTEIGAKFGYSLATGDFDNDNATDLVIGAPLSQGNNFIPDAGSFHVHYAPLKETPRQNVVRGKKPWGRFGLALSSVGDIDKDGFPDLAVGAPYEEGGGAVYIYNGGPQGLHQQPSQVLRPSDFGGGLLGLGFSVDGGIDMDDNGYPDMAIGALNSNKAILVRSAPVLTLVGDVKFESDSVTVEDKACYIDSAGYKKVKGICFRLKVNLQYKSERDLGKKQMEFRMRLEGQSDSPHNVFQTTNDYRYNRNISVGFVEKETPWSVTVFSKANRSAIGQRILASVSVHLLPDENGGSNDTVPPILDALSPTNFTTAVVVTCNNSSTCFSKPDMSLEGSAQPLLVGGEKASVNVQLRVKNDSAYSVEVKVQHPIPLTYHSVESQGQHPDCRYHNLVNVANPTEFSCQFGYIATDELVNFTLFFNHDPKSLMLHLNDSPLIVKMSVSSDSVDTNMKDNHLDVTIPTIVDAVLNTQQSSHEKVISVKVNQSASMSEVNSMLAGNSNFSVQRLGPEMIHEFLVHNRGPSPVTNIKLEVSIPLFTNGGQIVNYLYTPPETYGPVSCSNLETNTLSLRRGARHTTESEEHTRRKRSSEEFISHYSSSPEYLYDDYYSDYYYSDYHYYHYDSNALLTERRTLKEGEDEKDNKGFPMNSNKKSQASSYKKVVTCTSPKCMITCDISILPADDFVRVTIPSYLVVAGLDKLGYRTISLQTVLRMSVEQKNSTIINPTSIATTTVTLIKPDDVGFNNVPIWIWLLAVLVSLILILIMMALLWRVGFFKRNRPPTGQKRESLIHQEYSVCKPDPDSDVMKSVDENL